VANPLAIERLYANRRRLALTLAKIERQAETHRTTIAEIEAELRTLVWFVPPLAQRKPNPHFAHGELSRLCRDVMRERPGRRLYAGQIAVAIMEAKGLASSDCALCRTIRHQTQDALRRMCGRGSVVKAGRGSSARWCLPAASSAGDSLNRIGE
jgi:hypothetical protein